MNPNTSDNSNLGAILIAEDSQTQTEQLRYLLESNGYSVQAAANGKEALLAARGRKPDIIISDIVMPEMDGYALCRAIRADIVLSETPVVLLTSLASPHDVIEALRCGADNFIRKPYDNRHLLLRLQQILTNRNLRANEKVNVGVELYLGGEKHFITAERHQILDLLISTYEQAVQLCGELKLREMQVERTNSILKGIYKIAKGLNQALTEEEVLESVMSNALELPNVKAGWVFLRDGESDFRLVLARGMPPEFSARDALSQPCRCCQSVLSGDIQRATNIPECERLQKVTRNAGGLKSHVSLPFRTGDRVVGIMNLVGSEDVLFSEDDLRALNGIGNQIGVALGRSSVHKHLEDLVRERTANLTTQIAERSKLTRILETTPDFVGIADAAGRTIFLNRGGRVMLGINEEEALAGFPVAQFYPERERPFLLKDVLSAATREGIWKGESVLLHRNGNEVPVSQVTIVEKGPDGEVNNISVIARDISERKQSEMEVRKTQEWLQAILDASRDGVVAERNEIIVYANHAFARIHGYDNPAELIGRNISTVHAPEDRHLMRNGQRKDTEHNTPLGMYEFTLRRRDGNTVEVEAYQSSARIAGESFLITTVRDITERNLLQRQVAAAQKMESIGTLAGGVAHDFNNILGIIMGHSTLLEASLVPPEQRGDSLRSITQASKRGATLVRQLLTFARKSEAASEILNVNSLAKEIEAMLGETLPKSIVVTTELAQEIPPVIGDASQLHQVLLNLAVNARDAMPKGGKLTIRTAMVNAEAAAAVNINAVKRDHILIEVRDTGVGMDDRTREKIFEPFYTTKEAGKGTGLGLAVVFGIVNQLRGFIDVHTVVGEGTAFQIYLPQPDRDLLPVSGVVPKTFEDRKGTETILVIEDEDLLRDLINSLLSSMGYTVIAADDGLKGLAMFKARKDEIDLVISDFGLPGIDGLQLAQSIREMNARVRIVVASGYIEPEVREAFGLAGVTDFIQKPYSRTQILSTLGKILDAGKKR